jgi:hypothetical protein
MDLSVLIMMLAGLLALLLLLVVVYLLNRPKPASKRRPSDKALKPAEGGLSTFDALEAVILDPKSSKAELSKAVDAIRSNHAMIRAGTLERYTRLMTALCRHPHTDKSLVISLDKGLQEQNPNFRQELEAALQKGLNARG